VELKFTRSTDSEHEIELDSSLISASWRSNRAITGQNAVVEVSTAFVGNGAKIKIKVMKESGKKLGEIKDVIKNNSYVGEIKVPENIELDERIYFEVELPDNSLKGESGKIQVFPPVNVFNMKWSAREARRGDTLTLSAETNGVRDHTDVVVTIYEYDRDSAHDRIVELPATVMNNKMKILWEYEYHEDTDEIPSKEELDKYGGDYNPPEYFFTVKVGEVEFGKKQESKLLEFKDWIEIEVVDEEGTPAADREYTLLLPDGTERKGKLDKDGYVREEKIPPGRCQVQVKEPDDSNDRSGSRK